MIGLLLPFATAAGPADAGLLVEVTGAPTVQVGAAEPMPLAPFARLREGDVVALPDGATVRVVYYGSGHREAWSGPARFTVGPTASTPLAGAPVRADDLGPQVGDDLRSLAPLVHRAGIERSGQETLRGKAGEEAALDDEDRARVAGARDRYRALDAASGPGDVFPEVYLATVLLEHGLGAEAAELLASAARECPACDGPKQLGALSAKP